MAPKKILITGKGSYIGTSFANWLFNDPEYEVDELSLRGKDWKKNDFSKYHVVLHVAAIVHQKKKIDESEYYKVNTDLSVEVAEKAKVQGIKQFIYLSTMSVYGLEGTLGESIIINETTPLNPVTPYGKSKLSAEECLFNMSDNNFKIAIIRPPMVYGEGCKGNYQSLNKLIKYTSFFPDIENQRSMISIDNLCKYMKRLIDENALGVYLPQDNNFSSTKVIVSELASAHGKKMRFTKIFNPLVKLAAACNFKIVNKMFGNLTYSKSTINKDVSNTITE